MEGKREGNTGLNFKIRTLKYSDALDERSSPIILFRNDF